MVVHFTIVGIFSLITILHSSLGPTIDWNYPISYSVQRSSFTFAAYNSQIVTAIINYPNLLTPPNIIIQLYRPNQTYPQTPFQEIIFSGVGRFLSNPLDSSGVWSIQILPAEITREFVFTIDLFLDNTFEGYLTDVCRYSRFFIIYHNETFVSEVYLSGIPDGLANHVTMELRQGTSILDFHLGQTIFTTANKWLTSYRIQYAVPSTGYYYLTLMASDLIVQLGVSLSVKYRTQPYLCPFASIYSDVNGMFDGCQNNTILGNTFKPSTGDGCRAYNKLTFKCLECVQSYTLQDGSCYVSRYCPNGQYFHYGTCYNVTSNCFNYEPIGGRCLACKSQFVLTKINVNSTNNIICTSNTTNNTSIIQCNTNQTFIIALQRCMKNPPFCTSVNQSTSQCISCAIGYSLSISNNCQQTITHCDIGSYLQNNQCVKLENCMEFNPDNSCARCNLNYYLFNWSCVKIVCQNQYYILSGVCVKVSQQCLNAYDPSNGHCLRCTNPNYTLNMTTGICTVTNNAVLSNGCYARQYRKGNLCIQVSDACNTFNYTNGFCMTCVDLHKFVDDTGNCLTPITDCPDGQYFDYSIFHCSEVSALCLTYDVSNGNCVTCKYDLVLFQGKCIYLPTCNSTQYRANDGSCLNTNDTNCQNVQLATGLCLTCANGFDLIQGNCCFSLNYLNNPKCTQYLNLHCQSLNQQFLYCLVCSTGYTQKSGIFGPCTAS